MKFGFKPQLILDFDIEARPLGWYAGDFVHKEVTAIAWAWITPDGTAGPVTVRQMTTKPRSQRKMLWSFANAYATADIVVGHWIRSFDLPTVQTAMVDLGLPLLGEKMAHDTKSDVIRLGGISKSQENLASFLGIASPKVAMTQQDWREANRLTPVGLKLVRERVRADVLQNVEMRAKLLGLGLLDPPKLWLPTTKVSGDYTP